MPNSNFTCKDCPDRKPGCHDRCGKYRREKSAHEEQKKQERIRSGLDAADSKRIHWTKQRRTNREFCINKGGAHK